METVKLSSKGQIVIPKSVRESHHLAVGTEFIVSLVGDEIRLRPVPVFPSTHVAEVAGALAKSARKRLNDAETEHAIGQMLYEKDQESQR